MTQEQETDGQMLQRLGMDGHAWAVEFCKRFGEQSPDLETIHGWFANAIMAGYDHGVRGKAASEKVRREVAEEAKRIAACIGFVNDSASAKAAKRDILGLAAKLLEGLGEETTP